MEPTYEHITTEDIRTYIYFQGGEKPQQGSISVLLRNRGLKPVFKKRVTVAAAPEARRATISTTIAYYCREEVIQAFKAKPFKSFESRRTADVIDLEKRLGRRLNCAHYLECLDYATIGHIVDNKRVKKNFGCHKCDRYRKRED